MGRVISLESAESEGDHATEKGCEDQSAMRGIHMCTWQPGRGCQSRTMSMVRRTASPGMASTKMEERFLRLKP